MVATAPSVPSSLAGPSAQGHSAPRSASDRRGATQVSPENAAFEQLAHRPDRAVAASCLGRTRPHRRDSHRGRRRFSSQTRNGRYCRARYYHPALQRFISEDPVGFAGGDTNLFSYVVNNPINLYDPLGLWGLGVVGGGSAALGGGPVLPSAGLVAASGGGLFFGGPQGVNVGGFTSLGGFANLGAAGHPGSNFAFGGFAGLGGGAFLTNANSAADLAKTTHTASLDVGIGIIKGSIQLSYGGGVWSLSGTVGPGIGLSLSNLEATTRGSGQPTPSTALSSPDPFSSVSQGGPPRLGLSGRK
jgi:RHS repeat-associated protein